MPHYSRLKTIYSTNKIGIKLQVNKSREDGAAR